MASNEKKLDEVDATTKLENGSEPTSDLSPDDKNTDLHRGLKARHITLIAIGGAIGTFFASALSRYCPPDTVRYWPDHWHWQDARDRRARLSVDSVLLRRSHRRFCHVRPGRNGRLDASRRRFCRLCHTLLRSRSANGAPSSKSNF